MTIRTAEWFEVKINYDKMQEDGLIKPVNEQYVVDALSFTEAESSITEEMSVYINGEFKIKDIKKAAYKEILFSERHTDDRWFKAKVQFITIDEKTAKEKRSSVMHLCQAHTLQQAVGYLDEYIGKGMADYVVSSIQETQIQDVFTHDGTRKHLDNINGNADDDIVEYEAQQAKAEE